MKKRFVVWIGLLLGCISAVQAQQAKLCFVNMPDTICPLFTAVNRADFIDFLESKMKAVVTNRLGGKSEMTALSSDYLAIQTSAQSVWQMKVLPVNDSIRVICTVSTACAPVCDSHLRFFTPRWKELPASDYLPEKSLGIRDFLLPATDSVNQYRYEEACRQADLLLLKASLHPTKPILTFHFTTPEYLEKEVAAQLKPFVRDSIMYEWREGKFYRKE